MSYTTVEAALLTAIRTTSEFNANNSRAADPRILASGVKLACIITYAGHRVELVESPNRWSFHWTIVANLFFQGDGEYQEYNTLIGTTVQSVLTAVLGFPTLDGAAGVTHVVPGNVTNPDIWQGSGARNWWRVSFPFTITEMQTVPVSES